MRLREGRSSKKPASIFLFG